MAQRWITDREPCRRWPHYTRANAGEIAPEPMTPLGWTFGWEAAMGLGWADGYIEMGIIGEDQQPAPGVEAPAAVGLFGGYLYLNLSAARMIAVRNPQLTVAQMDEMIFGSVEQAPPYDPAPDDDREDLLVRYGQHMMWAMTVEEWPELEADAAAADALRRDRPDLRTLPVDALVARARSIQPLLRSMFTRCSIASVNANMAPGMLNTLADGLGDRSVAVRLLGGLGAVDSAEPAHALWDISRLVRSSAELTAAFDAGLDGLDGRLAALTSEDGARFRKEWDAFVARSGSRGPCEWDLGSPSWETAPHLALAAVDRIRLQSDDEGPAARLDALVADREALSARLADELRTQPDLLGLFELGRSTARWLRWRERAKTTIVRTLHEARLVFRELGRRAVADGRIDRPEQVFMLLDAEVEAFAAAPETFRDTLAGRAGQFAALARLDPPFVINADAWPPLEVWPARRSAVGGERVRDGDVLHGVHGAPGTATGRARVVLDAAAPEGLQAGEVLVAPHSDPSWTPLFLPAAAVVVNVGGQISHAVIVSRELGLPCVVSVSGATDRIPDGALVEVDGSTGTVTILSAG